MIKPQYILEKVKASFWFIPGLMRIAQDIDGIIILRHRPGDFLIQEIVLCEMLCNEECDQEIHEKVGVDFIIGKVRAPLQHAKMIMKAAEKSFSEKRDLEDMKKRFKILKEKQSSDE